MGFNVKKLLNIKGWRGPDATVKGRKEAIPPEWAADIVDLGGQRLVCAGKLLYADVYQELLRQHAVPLVQRSYPDWKYIFQRI